MTTRSDLLNLAQEIQRNPKEAQSILSSFKTEDERVIKFLSTLNVPAYVVPAIIATFATSYYPGEPKTVGDLVKKDCHLGCMFTLLDGTGYTYVGIKDGKALCRPDNSSHLDELDFNTEIKWIF